MKGRALLDELARFAATLGLEVRVQPFERRGSNAGGLCWLRGRALILIDGTAPVVEQTAALAEALTEALGPLDRLAPIVPGEVERALQTAAARVRWRRGRPGARRNPALERRVSVLRRPKPGLRATRPKR